MSNDLYKIVVFVPKKEAGKIRQVLGEAGAGKQGNYDFCSASSPVVGRFRPKKNAHPAIGRIGRIEAIAEEKIEAICSKKNLAQVIKAVIKAHPYEEPAIDIIPIVDWHEFNKETEERKN